MKQWKAFREDVQRFAANCDMIWLGDFNVRPGRPRHDHESEVLGDYGEKCDRTAHGDQFVDLLLEFQMVSLVGQKPPPNGEELTYSFYMKGKEERRSIPDGIFVSQRMLTPDMHATIESFTLTGGESHNPVYADVRLCRRRNGGRQRRRKKRREMRQSLDFPRDVCKKCKKAVHGREKFHKAVSELLESNGDLLGLETDQLVKAVFSDSQLKIFNDQAPKCQAPGAGGYVPRQEKNLEKSFRELNSTRKEWQSLGAVNGTAEYTAYKAAEKKHKDLSKKVKSLEEKFIHRKLQRYRETGDIKMLYKTLRQHKKGRFVTDRIACLVGEGGTASYSNGAILGVMKDYVSDLYAGAGPITEDDLILDESADFPEVNPLCDEIISKEDTEQALKKLSPRKAVGLDGLYAELFIGATPTEMEYFTIAFDKILASKDLTKFPKVWQVDRKKALYKQRGRRSDPSNYRQIGIQSTPRKIFATILQARIAKIVTLDPWQSAYQKGKRATDNVFALNEVLRSHHGRKGGNTAPIYAAVFDFSKAFDRVHIPTLIRKLREQGVGGKLLDTIKSMYIGAKSRVEVNGLLSAEFPVGVGVAQGCVLSPTLFSVYINDLFIRDSEMRDWP